MRLLQPCSSPSSRDATGEDHPYAQTLPLEPIPTLGQLPKWAGDEWDLPANFEFRGPSMVASGEGFFYLLFQNH